MRLCSEVTSNYFNLKTIVFSIKPSQLKKIVCIYMNQMHTSGRGSQEMALEPLQLTGIVSRLV